MKKAMVFMLAVLACSVLLTLFGCSQKQEAPIGEAGSAVLEPQGEASSAGSEPSQSISQTAPVPPDRLSNKPSEELVVFAAASLTEAMYEAAELFKEEYNGPDILFNFDSSGTLKSQIQEGALCDIFISAGQKQMNQLDITSDAEINTEGLDFVLQGSRFNIVSNKVVMIVPEGSDKGISDFMDILTDKVTIAAIGNADVPVGQYTEEIYTSLGVWEDLVNSGKISYGANVKEVLSQVEAAAVDCGIVYSTDAAAANGVTVAAQAPKGSHGPITYPAAIINTTKNNAAAKAFMEFLKSPQVSEIFERIGFTPFE